MDPGWSDKPAALETVLPKIMPSFLMLFDGLRRAYTYRATAEDEDSDDENGAESDAEEAVLSSDEDDLDDEGQVYLDQL